MNRAKSFCISLKDRVDHTEIPLLLAQEIVDTRNTIRVHNTMSCDEARVFFIGEEGKAQILRNQMREYLTALERYTKKYVSSWYAQQGNDFFSRQHQNNIT